MSGLVPKLRFKQGDGSDFPVWEEKRLGDVAICLDHKRKPLNSSERLVMQGDVPYYGANGIVDYIDNYIFNEPLILLAEDGGNFESFDTRPIAQNIQGKSWVNNHAHILKTKKITNHDYLFYSLVHKDIRKFINGSSRSKLNKSDMLIIPIPLPSLPEQQKIADFLSSIDAKIDTVKRKRDAFERYKKGLMQQIFAQKIRFKQEDGSDFPEWEEKRLGDVFQRITRKNTQNCLNVLTISAQHGLINQEKYFTKSVSAKNVANYYLLKKGEFAYNKSYSNGFPMGAIKKLNNYPEGVVSTLYICFTTKDTNLSTYFEKFFDSGGLNREIAKIAQEGARNHGLLNIGINDFFDLIYFLVPSPQEQQKIADFLSSIDAKINAIKTQVEKLEAFKQGLLQQMLV